MNEENTLHIDSPKKSFGLPGGMILPGIVLAVTAAMILWACMTYLPAEPAAAEFLFGGKIFNAGEIIRVESALAEEGLKNYKISEGRVEVPVAQRDQVIVALKKHGVISVPGLPQRSGGSIIPLSREEQKRAEISAKQTELARKIEDFRGIETADVFLDIQKTLQGMIWKEIASASVKVRSLPDVELQLSDIQAIHALVVRAVASLRPEDVVIVDSRVNRHWEWTVQRRVLQEMSLRTGISEDSQENSPEDEYPGSPGGDKKFAGRKPLPPLFFETTKEATVYVINSGGEKSAEKGNFSPAVPRPSENISVKTTEIISLREPAENLPAEKPENAGKRLPMLYEAMIGVLIFAVAGFLAAVLGNLLFRRKKERKAESASRAFTEEIRDVSEAIHEEKIVVVCETADAEPVNAEPVKTEPVNVGHEKNKEIAAEDISEKRMIPENPAVKAVKNEMTEEAVSEKPSEKPSETPENEPDSPEMHTARKISDALFGDRKLFPSPPADTDSRPSAKLSVSFRETDSPPENTEKTGTRESASGETFFLKTAAVKTLPENTSSAPERKSLRELKSAPPRYVAEALRNERPQAAAQVLRYVGNHQAAAVLWHFSPEKQEEIISRLKECEEIDEEILGDVFDSVAARVYALMPAEIHAEEVPSLTIPKKSPETPPKPHLPAETEKIAVFPETVLPEYEKLSFDDLLRFSDESLRTILKCADPQEAMLSFVSASPELQERFLGVMQPVYATQIRRCMKSLGPMRLSDLEESRRRMMTLVHQMAAERKIEIPAEFCHHPA